MELTIHRSFILLQNKEKRTIKVQADDPISFMQLVAKSDFGGGEVCWMNTVTLSSEGLFPKLSKCVAWPLVKGQEFDTAFHNKYKMNK